MKNLKKMKNLKNMKNGLGPSHSHPYFCLIPKQRLYVFPKESLLHIFSLFKAMCLCLKSFHLLSPGCDTVSLPDCQGLLSFLLKVIGSRVPGSQLAPIQLILGTGL